MGHGLRTGWSEGICGESGLGKSSAKAFFTRVEQMVAEFIGEEWQTFDVEDFGEFNREEFEYIFSASRIKAVYLIVKALGEQGLLTFDEFG